VAVVVVFSGVYDLSVLRELRRDLTPLQWEADVVLDFTEVTFLDRASVGEFIALDKARTALGFTREKVIVKAGSAIGRLLDILRLDEVFTIVQCDSDDSSVDSSVVQYAFAQGFVEPETGMRAKKRHAGPERRQFHRNWSTEVPAR
jgi:anti-anti-sigma regulatory factor